MGDAAAAREHRILMARQMANGLRTTASISAAPLTSAPTNVMVREFPAFVSPVSGRKAGGGYQPFSTDDPAAVSELQRQGAAALIGWLNRYRGAAELAGVDVTPIEEIAASLDGRVAGAA